MFDAAEISSKGDAEAALRSASISVPRREVIRLQLLESGGYAWQYPADPAWWGFRGGDSVEVGLL